MRFLFLIFLIVGLASAGYAVYTTKQRFDIYNAQLAEAQRAQSQQIEMIKVAVARHQLPYGRTLTENDVLFTDFPKFVTNDDWFHDAETLFGDGSETRQVVRVIERGEPILDMKITGLGEDAGLAARLGEGFRAFTIRVDVSTGVSGFLRPSDRVDVFWSGRFRGEAVTRLVMENLQIIAVDQISDQDRNRPVIARTITVRATPQQAALLAQAQTSGALSLSLRGIGDVAETGNVEVNLDDVVGYVAPEPVIAEEPVIVAPRRTITIRRGTDGVSIVDAD